MMGMSPLAAQERGERKPDGPPPHERNVPRDAPEAAKMREKMGEIARLHRIGKHEEARELAGKIRQKKGANARTHRMMGQAGRMGRPEAGRVMSPKDGSARQRAETPREKALHLRAAAQHLQAAGYEEQADAANKEMKRIITEARSDSEKQAKMKEAADNEAAKKKAAKKEKTKKEAAKPDSASMRDEMNKMRREMEELREQIAKMKAEKE